jgi:phytoene dehydrogenase-like protein
MPDVVIIGGGHNGLAAAFYLARGGFDALVLERREEVGGGAITGQLHPGFRCPVLAHDGCLHAKVAGDMDLAHHGLELLTPAAAVCAPAADGPPLVLYDDVGRTVDTLRSLSAADANAYPRYREAVAGVASVLAAGLQHPPPSIDEPGAVDIWNLLKAGRRFRALANRDRYRMLRWLPMPAADLVGEWFGNDLLQAALAAPGVSGTMLGPRSAGSALVMLLREAHLQLAGRPNWRARGGPGALTTAMAAAAAAAGAEIQTGVAVDRILTDRGRVRGVVAGGREIPAGTVVSAVDPKTTFLRLVDPVDLTPDFAGKMRNYRAAGTLAKVNLALTALPAFRGVADPALLSGRIHLGPDLDYLERAFDHAKYGEFSSRPWLDVTIPSLLDPQLAPKGAHVASIYVHYAPRELRIGTWEETREELLSAVLDVLELYAPGILSLVAEAQVITPAQLELEFGYWGGHVFHGELAPDQLFTMRPLLGYGKYDSPIQGLYLCGGGTHPGGFMTGTAGRLAAREVLRARRI